MDIAPLAGSICIDGQEIPFQDGQTILQAALAAGLNIPHLCYQPELEPVGSCRLCLVETMGRKSSACTLPATDKLVVASDTPALRKLRTTLVSFLLEHGEHSCLRCERSGDCRLQEAAALLNVPAVAARPEPSLQGCDDSHPEVSLNRDRCILCGICIQASDKLDGKNIFAFAGKAGKVALAVESDSGLLKDSAISADDHAVRLCPVGALTRKPAPMHMEFSSFDFFDSGF